MHVFVNFTCFVSIVEGVSMLVELDERLRSYGAFDACVDQMTELSPSARAVARAWNRLQDTRKEQHIRPDEMYLCAYWELEKDAGLSKCTIRKGLNQLVQFRVIKRRVVKAMRDRSAEMHLSKIGISSLEQADLNGDIPQAPVKPLPRCSCGEVHVIDMMTRTCKGCGNVQQVYQIDHAAHYDQIEKFYLNCLVKREKCHVPLGQMMKLYHLWFWQQDNPGTKKSLKSELVKRILNELGVQFKKNNTFRRYEGVGLTLYAQQLLEGVHQE
jgi:hypothetical protein